MTTMKRISLLLAPALLLSACATEVTDDGLPEDSGTPIAFQTPQTRAAIEDTDGMEAFSVWGGYDNNATNVFNGKEVTQSGGNWTYQGLQYWISGKTYDFYAVYPTVETLKTDGCTVSCTSEGVLSIKDFDATKGHDLMTAERKSMDGDEAETVAFTFQHKLAFIEFIGKIDPSTAAMLSSFTATVSTVRLYGMDKKGSYIGGSWTTEENSSGDSPFAQIDEDIKLGSEETSVLGDLLLFPQTNIPSTYTLHIDYDVSADGGQTTISKSMDVQLSSLGRTWEAGNRYRYIFTVIDEDHILFSTPTVTPWDESGGGIIVVE